MEIIPTVATWTLLDNKQAPIIQSKQTSRRRLFSTLIAHVLARFATFLLYDYFDFLHLFFISLVLHMNCAHSTNNQSTTHLLSLPEKN